MIPWNFPTRHQIIKTITRIIQLAAKIPLFGQNDDPPDFITQIENTFREDRMNTYTYQSIIETSNKDQDDLIIDLQGSKIMEWLLDRKKLPQHWKRNAVHLKKLIDEAIRTSPPTNVKLPESHRLDDDDETVGHSDRLNYFKCQTVLQDCLDAPNGSAKTLFGGYSNNATQKWNDVIKAYQKDYLYIGESCQTFTQSINYDIPNLKKIVEKSTRSLEDYTRKDQEYTKSRSSAQSALKKACQDLGIKGEKIREEIEELPKNLESIFDSVINLVNNGTLLKSINFYREVINATNCELNGELLALTNFLIQHGNITLGEREAILDPTYKVPKRVNTTESAQQQQQQQQPQLNFDIDTNVGGAAAGGINWEIDDQLTAIQEPAEIKWDEDFSVIDSSTSQDIVDDFSMMDAIEIIDESNSPVLLSASDASQQQITLDGGDNSGSGNTKVIDNPFESILGDRTLRNQFLDELYELEIFLKHRSVEMAAPEHVFGIDQINVESTNLDQCKQYLKQVTEIITLMTNHKIKHILEIKSSKKYIDRLVLQFNQKQGNIAKYTQMIADLDLKRKEVNQTLTESRKKLDQLIKDTRVLKTKLEGILVDVLDGKKANLMIQNVF
ncbi:DUF733 family protein [Heterostelium album PN500]|uniref:DUF733 family protein n=1 Tax=Heterostelium pallidum (strain ATCC 26659 / Pp 5 / PN500) TaxID=670386 RepID=D3BGW8_HETP5|nr:DUF733 family protein [Heterostelium album PN500]EFA79352.1 DUF733 family protein [Heterostelium album PN500]|eukprot:XP_020431473.1 DUF733 family protein [Heterostelium album PN500]